MSLIWCRHQNQTMPRRDEAGEYRRCLDCTERIPWCWPDGFPIRPPQLVQPRSWETFYRSLEIEEEVEVRQLG